VNKIRRIVDDIIYCPVNSRRFGVSLGINISGNVKDCSFNCIYCFRGFNENNIKKINFPKSSAIIKKLKEWFCNNPDVKIDDITIAGNGEPTDNPDFYNIINKILKFKNKNYPDIKISVLTNGMGLIPRINKYYRKNLKALNEIDRPCLKLDSALPQTWQKISCPKYKITFTEWRDAVKKLPNPIIQTMLIKGRVDNTTQDQIDELRKYYKYLNVKEVHVLTINKLPADHKIKPVDNDSFCKLKVKLEKYK